MGRHPGAVELDGEKTLQFYAVRSRKQTVETRRKRRMEITFNIL